MSGRDRTEVLIAGGGVAAVEAAMALRALAGPLISVTLMAPRRDLVYRPVSVAEPFEKGEVRRFSLDRIADELGLKLRPGALQSVDAQRRLVRTRAGDDVGYDVLLVAVGASPRAAIPGALTFRGVEDRAAMRELLDALEAGEVRRVAFALPSERIWPLPLYELALLTSAHLRAERVAGAELVVVTPEDEPLVLFGGRASEAVRELLDERGIELRAASRPDRVEDGALVLAGSGLVRADRTVALPEPVGPAIAGLPHDSLGFIPVDEHGAVPGVPDVYAAGDCTAFPLKQGGLAAQQADAAAEAIAAAAGVAIEPAPFRPVLRGLLLTGAVPLYLRAEPGAVGPATATAIDDLADRPRRRRRADSVASEAALWWPPSKIAGKYLGPYFATARPHPLGAVPLRDRVAPAGGDRAEARREHNEALDLTLLLADHDARWGDYRMALRALEAAEALAGALPPEYEAKRARWLEASAGKRAPAAGAIHPRHVS